MLLYVPNLQECSLERGDTCNIKATAKVVYEAGAEDASGGSSARGVDSISNKENLQKIASSAGVEASEVRLLFCTFFFFLHFFSFSRPVSHPLLVLFVHTHKHFF